MGNICHWFVLGFFFNFHGSSGGVDRMPLESVIHPLSSLYSFVGTNMYLVNSQAGFTTQDTGIQDGYCGRVDIQEQLGNTSYSSEDLMKKNDLHLEQTSNVVKPIFTLS